MREEDRYGDVGAENSPVQGTGGHADGAVVRVILGMGKQPGLVPTGDALSHKQDQGKQQMAPQRGAGSARNLALLRDAEHSYVDSRLHVVWSADDGRACPCIGATLSGWVSASYLISSARPDPAPCPAPPDTSLRVWCAKGWPLLQHLARFLG